MGEIVTNPKHDSIQLALVPAEAVELQVQFWVGDSEEAVEPKVTPRRAFGAGELAVFDLTGLTPGTLYRYQVLVRSAGGSQDPTARPVGSFRTLRSDRDADVSSW